MKYAIFNVAIRNNWMNLLPITQNELELLSSFEHSVEAAKADMAERLKSGVSVEPGRLTVDLTAIHTSRAAVVPAAARAGLRIADDPVDDGTDDRDPFERYSPLHRILSEEDVVFLKSQGASARKVRAFRRDRRKAYWAYVRSFEQEMAAALDARKACMASRGEWDFPALLRQMREVTAIRLKLRSAWILHWLHMPVNSERLIEAALLKGWLLMNVAPSAG